MDQPKGIWYEESRHRWRVKVFRDGALHHRSYHHTYEEAYRKWSDVRKELTVPVQPIPIAEASLLNTFLCRPVTLVGRGNDS